MTVLIVGNRITAVGNDGDVRVPDDADVIDASGQTLMPGLWDMHVHLDDTSPILDIANGVTTVRDLGNRSSRITKLVAAIEGHELVGPRIIKGGLIDGEGPFANTLTDTLVSTQDDARKAVAHYAALGYDQIKIYGSVPPRLVPTIVAEAHRSGMRVSGHVPTAMSAEEVVRLGFDEIQHIGYLVKNFYPEAKGIAGGPPTRTTTTMINALDLTSAGVTRFVELLRARRTVIDVTANVMERRLLARSGKVDPTLAEIAPRLPYQTRRALYTAEDPISSSEDAGRRNAFAKILQFVKLLHDKGVHIVAGTDGQLAAFPLARELELYSQAGMNNADILRIATLGAAEVTKRNNMLGSVSPGKVADLILVEGDPLARIGDLRRVRTVIKDGVVYDPAPLLRAVGIKE